ncbi:MAG: SpoIVB peptidase [Clostridia bacterium]|nr:SpoIVB peptidase [Clostridia bacterium]
MKRILSSCFAAWLIFLSQTSAVGALFTHEHLTVYQSESDLARVRLAQSVTVLADHDVYLGGRCVGVALYTEGLLINSLAAIEAESGAFVWPAQQAGLRKGDVLLAANGESLHDGTILDTIVQSAGENAIKLTVKRGEKQFETEITPVKSKEDGKTHLGLWLRDSAAGMGTVTYVDPVNGQFLALGHAICDADTGQKLTVRQGKIVACRITGVKKGKGGSAGELQGVFGVNAEVLGSVEGNSAFGLYGKAEPALMQGTLIPLGSRDLVHEGKAEIYSDFEGGDILAYEIEITHVNHQTYPSEKSLVLRVTDERLIEKTGGIVQGLSGSPIVQDGRLIGAVTHVMISDASRGYGIFAQWMDAA